MKQTDIIIPCKDGFELTGTLFCPPSIKGAIMIAPATGIKRQFYQSFSSYICSFNYAVLTFDNRGIGQSIGNSLNDGNPSLYRWGKLDMTAVLNYLQQTFPNVDYHLIGHSAGGQLVGLMENAQALKSIVNYGSSSGSTHNFSYPFKLISSFYLNVYIPINNLLFGHTKSQWVGMGEPLPKQVGNEWRKWCTGSGYVAVDLNTKIKNHLYHKLDINSLWLHAEDDQIANLKNVKEMIEVYSKIHAEIVTLSPEKYGFKKIGHMAFFSKKKKKLWSMVTNWLNEQSSRY